MVSPSETPALPPTMKQQIASAIAYQIATWVVFPICRESYDEMPLLGVLLGNEHGYACLEYVNQYPIKKISGWCGPRASYQKSHPSESVYVECCLHLWPCDDER